MKPWKFALILVALLSINVPSFSQDSSAVESFEVLSIFGNVSHLDETLEGVSIELYEGNKVVDEVLTKKNGKFKFTLSSERIYTIEKVVYPVLLL